MRGVQAVHHVQGLVRLYNQSIIKQKNRHIDEIIGGLEKCIRNADFIFFFFHFEFSAHDWL